MKSTSGQCHCRNTTRCVELTATSLGDQFHSSFFRSRSILLSWPGIRDLVTVVSFASNLPTKRQQCQSNVSNCAVHLVLATYVNFCSLRSIACNRECSQHGNDYMGTHAITPPRAIVSFRHFVMTLLCTIRNRVNRPTCRRWRHRVVRGIVRLWGQDLAGVDMQ